VRCSRNVSADPLAGHGVHAGTGDKEWANLTFPDSGDLTEMDITPTKEELERRLAGCLELAREYPHGSIAEMIRDMEEEVREQLRTLEKGSS
jgi:hypothetical protein